MAEFVANTQEIINRGDPITIENRCKHSFSAGTGIVFHENGEYKVTVNDHKIIVEESRFARPAYSSECLNVPRKHNEDSVRAMTDEKLAEIMVSGCQPDYPHGQCREYEKNDGNLDCPKCWLDWLKQEAEA